MKIELLSIKMEANQSISNFISRIKYLSDKLGDIGEKVSSIDLVTITLKGLVQDYEDFISTLSARPKSPTFDELTRVLLQEEERMKNYELDSHSSDSALIAKGKPWDKYRSMVQEKHKGMAHSDTYIKRNVGCDYCGKPRNLAKDCFKRKNHESKSHESKQRYKRQNENFLHKDTSISNGFKNLSCLFLKLHFL